MSTAANTTILVPTFNRPFHVHRLLSYYASCGFRGQIKILDSGTGSANGTAQVPGLRVERHCFNSDIAIQQKVSAGLRLIDTPYVQMCADDDFIDPQGIAECERFLDSNSDFAAAQGECIHFTVDEDPDNNRTVREFRREPMHDLAHNDAVTRLCRHTVEYRPTHYALQRTEILTADFVRIDQIPGPSLLLLEPMHSFACVTAGKVKRLPVSFEYREQHGQRLSGQLPNWSDLVIADNWPQQFQMLRRFVSELLAPSVGNKDCDDIATYVCQEWLKLCFDKYFVRKPEISSILQRSHSAQEFPVTMPQRTSWQRGRQIARTLVNRSLERLATVGRTATGVSSETSADRFPDKILQAVLNDADLIYGRQA